MRRHDALPLSLFNPYANLPCDGKVGVQLKSSTHACAAQLPFLHLTLSLVEGVATDNSILQTTLQTRSEAEEACDPYTRNCQVCMY